MRKILAFLVGAAVAFAIGMLFYEAFLRYSGSVDPSMVESDPDFGLRLIKNHRFVLVNEGFSIGKVNKYGYLGPGYPPEKPVGVVRIALMGDSYVAAHQLFDRHHFRSLLEKRLNEIGGPRVEVLNFGFPATNFEQMYMYYRIFAEKFDPDYVLYFIGTSSLNTPSDEVGPRLKVEGDSLRIDESFRKSPAFARRRKLDLISRLAMYSLFRKAKEVYARGNTPDVVFDKFYRLVNAGKAARAGGGSMSVEKPERLPLNHAIVERLGADNRTPPPTSIIVIRDGLPQEFVDFAIADGVQCFDPTPALDSLATEGIDPHYWKGSHRSGHWNQYAHRAVAAYLERKFIPLLDSRVSGL